MKILHCADLHLDSKMTANLSKLSKEKVKERKMEILRTFSRMVDYANKNNISVILIAGDLFDTHKVSAMVRNTVRDVIVQNPQIDFLYLKGNHDNDNFLEHLEEVPENLLFFGDKWTTYTYGNVTITGIELDNYNHVSAYETLVLNESKYNIVMMHGQLEDYTSKDEIETICLDNLKDKYIDYLALGHIHKYRLEVLDNRGMYCYPGCLEGRGFDECGEKGFVVLDIDERMCTAKTEFVPIAFRTLHILPVDITGIQSTKEAGERIETAIKKLEYSSKSLMNFILQGEIDVECELETDFLEEQFSDYFYFEKVSNEARLLVNYNAYEKDASLKGEFIRFVGASDLEEQEKANIIRTGILALQGEEIS